VSGLSRYCGTLDVSRPVIGIVLPFVPPGVSESSSYASIGIAALTFTEIKFNSTVREVPKLICAMVLFMETDVGYGKCLFERFKRVVFMIIQNNLQLYISMYVFSLKKRRPDIFDEVYFP
jgi:hypothetical protein